MKASAQTGGGANSPELSWIDKVDVQLIDLREVCKITSLSKTSIYELVKSNEFPPPIPVSSRRVAWHKASVVEWVRGRVYASEEFREYIRRVR